MASSVAGSWLPGSSTTRAVERAMAATTASACGAAERWLSKVSPARIRRSAPVSSAAARTAVSVASGPWPAQRDPMCRSEVWMTVRGRPGGAPGPLEGLAPAGVSPAAPGRRVRWMERETRLELATLCLGTSYVLCKLLQIRTWPRNRSKLHLIRCTSRGRFRHTAGTDRITERGGDRFVSVEEVERAWGPRTLRRRGHRTALNCCTRRVQRVSSCLDRQCVETILRPE